MFDRALGRKILRWFRVTIDDIMIAVGAMK